MLRNMADGTASGGSFHRDGQDSSSFVITEMPRGNPRRYPSHGFVRMAPANRPPFDAMTTKNSVATQETETEGERHFKRLLDKQLKKDISLQQLSDQTRHFVKSSFYKPFTDEIVGKIELEDFKSVENRKAQLEKLQQCGLDQSEIKLWFSHHQRATSDCGTLAIEPTALRNKLETIESKIKAKDTELEENVYSRDIRVLNRHEMEIEASLKSTDERAQLFQKLIRREHPGSDNSCNDLKKLEEEMFGHLKSKKRKKSKRSKQDPKCASESISSAFPRDSDESQIATCSARPIEDDEIRANKLSVDQIKKVPRFANYECGEPNNVLYVKNLTRQVDVIDLGALFNRFSEEDGITPSIRLLSGKMHGQAFITFSSVEFARNALDLINGYVLYGKPIIIQYKLNIPP